MRTKTVSLALGQPTGSPETIKIFVVSSWPHALDRHASSVPTSFFSGLEYSIKRLDDLWTGWERLLLMRWQAHGKLKTDDLVSSLKVYNYVVFHPIVPKKEMVSEAVRGY